MFFIAIILVAILVIAIWLVYNTGLLNVYNFIGREGLSVYEIESILAGNRIASEDDMFWLSNNHPKLLSGFCSLYSKGKPINFAVFCDIVLYRKSGGGPQDEWFRSKSKDQADVRLAKDNYHGLIDKLDYYKIRLEKDHDININKINNLYKNTGLSVKRDNPADYDRYLPIFDKNVLDTVIKTIYNDFKEHESKFDVVPAGDGKSYSIDEIVNKSQLKIVREVCEKIDKNKEVIKKRIDIINEYINNQIEKIRISKLEDIYKEALKSAIEREYAVEIDTFQKKYDIIGRDRLRMEKRNSNYRKFRDRLVAWINANPNKTAGRGYKEFVKDGSIKDDEFVPIYNNIQEEINQKKALEKFNKKIENRSYELKINITEIKDTKGATAKYDNNMEFVYLNKDIINNEIDNMISTKFKDIRTLYTFTKAEKDEVHAEIRKIIMPQVKNIIYEILGNSILDKKIPTHFMDMLLTDHWDYIRDKVIRLDLDITEHDKQKYLKDSIYNIFARHIYKVSPITQGDVDKKTLEDYPFNMTKLTEFVKGIISRLDNKHKLKDLQKAWMSKEKKSDADFLVEINKLVDPILLPSEDDIKTMDYNKLVKDRVFIRPSELKDTITKYNIEFRTVEEAINKIYEQQEIMLKSMFPDIKKVYTDINFDLVLIKVKEIVDKKTKDKAADIKTVYTNIIKDSAKNLEDKKSVFIDIVREEIVKTYRRDLPPDLINLSGNKQKLFDLFTNVNLKKAMTNKATLYKNIWNYILGKDIDFTPEDFGYEDEAPADPGGAPPGGIPAPPGGPPAPGPMGAPGASAPHHKKIKDNLASISVNVLKEYDQIIEDNYSNLKVIHLYSPMEYNSRKNITRNEVAAEPNMVNSFIALNTKYSRLLDLITLYSTHKDNKDRFLRAIRNRDDLIKEIENENKVKLSFYDMEYLEPLDLTDICDGAAIDADTLTKNREAEELLKKMKSDFGDMKKLNDDLTKAKEDLRKLQEEFDKLQKDCAGKDDMIKDLESKLAAVDGEAEEPNYIMPIDDRVYLYILNKEESPSRDSVYVKLKELIRELDNRMKKKYFVESSEYGAGIKKYLEINKVQLDLVGDWEWKFLRIYAKAPDDLFKGLIDIYFPDK